jgi:RNA polymerase sigma-70 factor (ECF subfamily)
VPVSANGQPAVAAYVLSADGCHRAHGVAVLDIVQGRVSHIVAFNDASLVPVFGLPTVYAENPR